jgi:hypothetical protein
LGSLADLYGLYGMRRSVQARDDDGSEQTFVVSLVVMSQLQDWWTEIMKGFSLAPDVPSATRVIHELQDLCSSWHSAHPLVDVDSLLCDVSFMLPLTDFFLGLLSTCVRALGLPAGELSSRLGLRPLLPFVARALSATAATYYARTSAWSANSEYILQVVRRFGQYHEAYCSLGKWFSQFSLFLAVERDPSDFVRLAIAAFGARPWLESDGAECAVEPWLPACLLCRFFVALLSDFTAPDRWEPSDVTRRSVLHMLALGSVVADDVVGDDITSSTAKQVGLEALREFGDPFMVKNQRHYKLKAACENAISPFWIYYDVSTFLKLLSRSADSRPPRLLPLPLPGQAARLVLSAPFVDFVVKAVRIFRARPEQASAAAHFSLLALIQMANDAAQETLLEAFVRAGVFSDLAAVPGIRQRGRRRPPRISTRCSCRCSRRSPARSRIARRYSRSSRPPGSRSSARRQTRRRRRTPASTRASHAGHRST